MSDEKRAKTIDEAGNEVPLLPPKRKHQWGPSRVGHGEMRYYVATSTKQAVAEKPHPLDLVTLICKR